MAQLCNISYAYQVETKATEEELVAFVDGLPLAPGELPRRRAHVSDDLLRMMAPSSSAG